MPLPGETGRWKHHVLRLSVRLFVRLFHHLLQRSKKVKGQGDYSAHKSSIISR